MLRCVVLSATQRNPQRSIGQVAKCNIANEGEMPMLRFALLVDATQRNIENCDVAPALRRVALCCTQRNTEHTP